MSVEKNWRKKDNKKSGGGFEKKFSHIPNIRARVVNLALRLVPVILSLPHPKGLLPHTHIAVHCTQESAEWDGQRTE